VIDLGCVLFVIQVAAVPAVLYSLLIGIAIIFTGVTGDDRAGE
jgi:hypothetical protein